MDCINIYERVSKIIEIFSYFYKTNINKNKLECIILSKKINVVPFCDELKSNDHCDNSNSLYINIGVDNKCSYLGLNIMSYKMLLGIYEENKDNFTDILNSWIGISKEKESPNDVKKEKSNSKNNTSILEANEPKICNYLKNRLNVGIVFKNKKFYSEDNKTLIMPIISKNYNGPEKKSRKYWYGIHQYQLDKVKEFDNVYFLFGFKDAPERILVDVKYIIDILPKLNSTTTEKETYYHIHIFNYEEMGYQHLIPNNGKKDLNSQIINNSLLNNDLKIINKKPESENVIVISNRYKTIRG